MITLDSEYQYIGRTNGVKAYGYNFYFYILLYAKTTGDPATGKHTVGVKMRLASSVDSTFYKWYTSGSAEVDGVSAIAWSKQKKPAAAWPTTSLTEDGVTYPRWVDLGEGTAEVDTEYGQKEVAITASWQRLAISTTPPAWLPSTTKATASIPVLLPSIIAGDPVEPEPEPEPEPAPTVPDGVLIFADGVLVCDSRLEDHDLAGLKLTHGLNVGGTAEITMPLGHPAYNSFTSQTTIVTIYRNGRLRFRGRALYAAENFYGQRTVTCEGELCLLRDTINRPYKYQATPRSCFVTLINQHNAQTDPEKKFTVGAVTVVDANDYILLESESAEPTLDTLNKLVDRCGGFITFTDDGSGGRVINWLAAINSKSNQVIEFGENLLDFSSTGANTTDLATGLVPYGAKDEKTGKRITIESVNGGKDYIIAEDARAVRRTIFTTETWDDVTDAATLLKKARARLDERKLFITSLQLTALDLSHLDRSLDSFAVGDMIRVISSPHGVDEYFQLAQLTEDLVNPASGKITLGKDVQSLTGADAAGDSRNKNAINSAIVKYDGDLQQVASSVEATVLEKTSLIYVPQDAVAELAEELEKTDEALLARIVAEENARAGVINKISGTVHIGGGAPINMLGGKIDIDGSEINFLKEIRFKNESGVRIADKDGNFYYVLRVDASNSCVVGNDYTNLYLRGKDAVYLYKTGAVVTSDQRQKNGVEALPGAYMTMLDNVTPVRFKYNGRGDKYHVGFTAQDVDAALAAAGLTREDFGGFVDVAGDGSELGLAYDEFIGLLLEKTRRLEARIKAMEEKDA